MLKDLSGEKVAQLCQSVVVVHDYNRPPNLLVLH